MNGIVKFVSGIAICGLALRGIAEIKARVNPEDVPSGDEEFMRNLKHPSTIFTNWMSTSETNKVREESMERKAKREKEKEEEKMNAEVEVVVHDESAEA